MSITVRLVDIAIAIAEHLWLVLYKEWSLLLLLLLLLLVVVIVAMVREGFYPFTRDAVHGAVFDAVVDKARGGVLPPPVPAASGHSG